LQSTAHVQRRVRGRAWGDNDYGKLGDGSTTDRNTTVGVSNRSGVQAIALGDYHSLALKEDGTLWTWGRKAFGQLGAGTSETDRTTPAQVQNLSGVKTIAAGEHYSLAKVSEPPVAQQ
jgi:alpha-tubulin suppressor-like RCC1 family protein